MVNVDDAVDDEYEHEHDLNDSVMVDDDYGKVNVDDG